MTSKKTNSQAIFWDTSGFYAILNSDDINHQKVLALLENFGKTGRGAITTDWVIGETCTLLSMRKRPHLVAKFLALIESSRALKMIHVDNSYFEQSKKLILQNPSMGYSFTDCTSFIIMKDLRLNEAMTSDGHFNMAGFAGLLTIPI